MRSFLFLLLTPLALLAQKPQNYTVVTGELTQKIISTQTSGQPMRLAVVPFTGTRGSVQTSVSFGEYLTETIIGSLAGHGEKIKLFERTRLDAILKEHEFILTDLMKPAAALKIGQLAPIDALLSGTYTKLKSYVDVSARVIDVASGEITASYTGRIKMNKNLAALFTENDSAPSNVSTSPGGNPQAVNVNISNTNPSTGTPPKSKGDLCKQKVEEFKSRLNDLSTVEKINNVVTEAKKTPFDNLCGQLHYHVIYSFMRFNIQNTQYKEFLLLTLDTIAYPAGDERALEIVRFLSSDNDVDEREWRTGLGALSRIGNYSLSTYINYLIAKPKAATEKTVQGRIEDYFTLASHGKIGLPTAISLDAAFFEMTEGVQSSQPLRQYVYGTYADRIKTDDKSSAALFSLLHSIYKEENQPARKTEIMGWIIDFVNAHEYPKAHDQLFDFAFAFQLTLNEHRNEEIKREFHGEDLKLLTQRCQEKFSKCALMSPYQSQKEDRVDFCVQYNIPIPGVIPTMEEAEIILKGNNLDELFRVMQLLTLMEDRPKKIENALISLFSKRSLEDRGKLMEIQVLSIVVLGNVKTSNVKAVEFMIGTLPNYGNDTEASQVALVKIGKPAVPALISKLDKTTEMDGGLQYQLITLLGRIGKDAAPAERSIQRILDGSRSNSDVRYAAEAALLAIR